MIDPVIDETSANADLPVLLVFEERQVRVFVDADGELWWVAADVCSVLDLRNSRRAVAALDADEKGLELVDTPAGPRKVVTVSEPGLYALILRSRKPAARRFSRWVRHDVLPTLRRTGRYEMAPDIADTPPEPDDAAPPRDALMDPDVERMWQQRITMYRRVCGRATALWALRRSPFPMPGDGETAAVGTMPAADDTVGRFVDEQIRPCAGGHLAGRTLYEAYAAWCRRTGRTPVSQTMFGRAVGGYGIAKDRNGGRVRYRNVALTDALAS